MEEEFLNGLDALFAVNKLEEAQEYLESWYQKSVSENNWHLQITVLNEMLGFYRSIGEEKQALDTVEKTLKLVQEHELAESPDVGTIWINVGTTLCRFYRYEEGLAYYQKAEKALENCDNTYLLASLYNNSAAAYEAAGNTEVSIQNYEKSLKLLEDLPDCITLIAVTYANMANSYLKSGQEEKAALSLQKMDAILDDPNIPWEAGYASACVKCGSLHFNIGNEERAKELNERARQIYEGGIL
jgi:tetratricopeptide (TPR) repeat protein